MQLVVLLIVVSAFTDNFAAGEKCTLATNDANKEQFFDQVKTIDGKNYTVSSQGAKYTLRWCASVNTQPNASVVMVENAKEHVIGRFNETDVISTGGWNMVTFAGGELMNATGRCNGTRWTSVILMECDPKGSENLTVLEPLNAGCFAVFHLNTSALCPVSPLPPPIEQSSRWTVFFMLIFTAGICYLVIGMAYRRFVLGAKGLEQIPNYDFWRDPCGYTRDYCNRRDLRNNEPWSNASHMNDNVDEPLLHP